MKKLVITLSTIFCTALVVISILSFTNRPSKKFDSPQQTEYTISDYHGKLAVFEQGNTEPVVVYEIYTHLLPENDIELLRKGITVFTPDELQSRLEDFGL